MPHIEIQRRLEAPAERVFQAWSEPEQMERWFFAGHRASKVTNDFRVGGSYRVAMIESDSGNDHTHSGIYKEIVPHRKIAFTWSNHLVEDTLVTLTLEAKGEATLMTLRHDFFADEEKAVMHNLGWNGCLDHLETLISGKVSAQI